MVKGKSPGPLSNSARKKKLKPSEDDVTDVPNGRTGVMNGKTKKRRKTSDEVCEYAQNGLEDNEQIESTDPTNTDKCKDKKKKRKSEIKEPEANTDTNADQEVITPKKKRKSQIPQKAQIEDTTLQQEDNTKKKKTKSSGDVKKTPLVQEPCGEDEDGSGEEDLSPEEKRVLERKLKKIRNKEEKKKIKEEGNGTEQEKIKTNVAEKQALEYLTCWSERRDEWKFQKSRQTWLLKHMYDSTKVPDSSFEVLLSYMEGLRGAAREISLKKAEVLVRWEGQGGEADAADAEKRRNRAKLVMQQL